MTKFILGVMVGIFLIPIVKEIMYQKHFERGIQAIFKNPIDFIKEVIHRTFTGGY